MGGSELTTTYEWNGKTWDLAQPVIDGDGDEWVHTGRSNNVGALTWATVGMRPEDGWPLNLIQFLHPPLTQR